MILSLSALILSLAFTAIKKPFSDGRAYLLDKFSHFCCFCIVIYTYYFRMQMPEEIEARHLYIYPLVYSSFILVFGLDFFRRRYRQAYNGKYKGLAGFNFRWLAMCETMKFILEFIALYFRIIWLTIGSVAWAIACCWVSKYLRQRRLNRATAKRKLNKIVPVSETIMDASTMNLLNTTTNPNKLPPLGEDTIVTSTLNVH